MTEMRRAVFVWPVLLILSTFNVLADARMTVLVDVLKLGEATRILADEGLTDSQSINEDMLDGQGGAGWALQVERIYEPTLMVELVRAELEKELSGEVLEDVITFYASPLGTEIIDLENAARVAIQDDEVETAARARFETMLDTDDPRLALINQLIVEGDMITRNVTNSMNSNFQFLRGLEQGGAIEMSEEDMLGDVARDIQENTTDTTSWLSSYMLLAYHPLTDSELQSYLAFAQTEAGLALNRALFEGFGKAYEDISYGLGRAVALNMTAEEL